MAIGLAGDQFGRMHDPRGGYWDLRDRTVRVLHTRSFVDDPTRLLRALRYEARLDFSMDTDTEALARQAGARGAVATVSRSRVRDGLRLLLAEDNFPAALRRMRELELDHALHPALTVDPDLAASAALGAVDTGANRLMASLSALVWVAPEPLLRWLDELNLPAEVRQRVTRAVLQAPAVAQSLSPELPNSALHDLLHGAPPEVLALALALGAPAEPVLRYAKAVSATRLEIDGSDLLAAGVPQSPALGAALHETLRRKLDGAVSGRDEELRTAVELARRGT
jgi:tRNA nucleotidyltransferase (CCA-adding enzyme)